MSAARVDRRTLLRAGAATVLASALPGLLAGCGDSEPGLGPQARAVAARSIAIDYASYYPPAEQLRRLVRDRARAHGARVSFSDDAAGADAQLAAFRALTSERSGFRAVVVAPFDASALAPIAAAAIRRGVQIVSYAVPLADQSATISADPARAGRLLARHAARWAARALPDGGELLLVRPPTTVAAGAPPDQFAPLARPWEEALLAELATAAPALRAVAATSAQSDADAQPAVARALQDYPRARVVLAWNDATAVGAARALRAANPGAAQQRRLYAGGVGAPALATAGSLDALREEPVLRCLVAPRLRDLADALVAVPLALLSGGRARAAGVPLVVLGKGAPQLGAFADDYRSAG